jgi:MoaA/NifB/PqqE/SkfB family radical SAM enzyme
MSQDEKLIKEINQALKNSTILRKNKNFVDRISFMKENMKDNKAFVFNKGKDIEYFLSKFKNYRDKWNDQPNGCVKKKLLSNDLKKKNISPLSIDIEVSAFCDLACPFCFREAIVTPDKIIDEQFCYKLIDQAAEMEVPSIKFNWRGEPLLHPKISNFISYAKKKGIIDTIINTNATHLTAKKSEELIKSGLDYIIYSFDGGTKKTYEKMRPGRFKKNNFDTIFANIKKFKEAKEKLNSKFPYTKIQMIITHETVNEVSSFFNMFNSIVDDVSVISYTERGGDFDKLSNKEKSIYNEKIKKYNLPDNTPYSRNIEGDIKVSKKRLPCEQPYQRLMVTYEGKVAMCCMDWGAKHPVGYVNSKGFKNNKDYEQIFERIQKQKKGFELMSKAKMPENYNPNLKQEVQGLEDIWLGKEIDVVRKKQITNEADKLAIFKN